VAEEAAEGAKPAKGAEKASESDGAG
jgi:hypothetical protein